MLKLILILIAIKLVLSKDFGNVDKEKRQVNSFSNLNGRFVPSNSPNQVNRPIDRPQVMIPNRNQFFAMSRQTAPGPIQRPLQQQGGQQFVQKPVQAQSEQQSVQPQNQQRPMQPPFQRQPFQQQMQPQQQMQTQFKQQSFQPQFQSQASQPQLSQQTNQPQFQPQTNQQQMQAQFQQQSFQSQVNQPTMQVPQIQMPDLSFGCNNSPGSFRTCNFAANSISSGTFVGRRKRSLEKVNTNDNKRDIDLKIEKKRQFNFGNFGNFNLNRFGFGSAAGRPNVANLMAESVRGATFSGQANVMDGSMSGMGVQCDSTGCRNFMG